VKRAIDSVWLRRALASLALAAGLAVAAIVLHPPPPPASRLDAAADSPAPRHEAPPVARRRGVPAGSGPPPDVAVVYVAGAVARPGVYTVATTARVLDALARAGGANADADLLRVNLAARVNDGEEIAVLRRGEAAPSARRTAAPNRPLHRKKRRAVEAVAAEPLDLNSATADELAELPGLGSELADRIVQFRDVNGPFTSVDELADVSGMTPARLDRLTDRLIVR
jgi:competence protein ComEA